ncbi:MAG: helix-turn-helix domain-containing protein [Rhodococcus sp. (in: high G+C Gram-positive bacteria)]
MDQVNGATAGGPQGESVDGPQDADTRRRRMLAEIHSRRHEISTKLVDEYRTVIAEYRELPEAVLMRDVAEAAVQNIEYLVKAFTPGFQVDGHDVEWITRSAARRVHQRVSLPSLLRTYRLWGNHLWRTMAMLAGDDEVGRQVAIEAAAAMMDYVDDVSLEITQAYLRESDSAGNDGRTLRSDVLETLLSGDPVNERARRQSAVLALSLRVELVVVVLQLTARDDPLTGTPAALRMALDHLAPVARSFLVGARGTEVVCICTLEANDCGEIEAACHDLAGSHHGWIVGIGRTASGIVGVRRSYAEAREAVDLGLTTRRPRRAIRFADVLLDQILRATSYSDALLDETIRPLVDYDERKGSELVPTLRAYVAAGFNLTKAAAELTVNPNTVVYRLRRIHSLTRRDPSSVDDLLLLTLGLRLFDSAPPV